jgi:hypothetical protein
MLEQYHGFWARLYAGRSNYQTCVFNRKAYVGLNQSTISRYNPLAAYRPNPGGLRPPCLPLSSTSPFPAVLWAEMKIYFIFMLDKIMADMYIVCSG